MGMHSLPVQLIHNLIFPLFGLLGKQGRREPQEKNRNTLLHDRDMLLKQYYQSIALFELIS